MSMTRPYRPQVVSDISMAFPAEVTEMMPRQSDIPEEFKRSSNPWVRLQHRWFCSGLAGAGFFPKDGVDPALALRHLKCVQGSFEPKHEHKMSAVAFLLSEWFDDVTIDGTSVVKS